MKRLADFTETKEKVTFTYSGWDGTGYDGEGKTQRVWRRKNSEDKFICKWMPCYHSYCILKVDESYRHEKSGLPTVDFYCEFDPSMMEK